MAEDTASDPGHPPSSWTGDPDSSLLVSHNHSLEKEDTPGKDHTGLVLGNSEQRDTKEGRLCSIKREACLLVPGGGCNCLL